MIDERDRYTRIYVFGQAKVQAFLRGHIDCLVGQNFVLTETVHKIEQIYWTIEDDSVYQCIVIKKL